MWTGRAAPRENRIQQILYTVRRSCYDEHVNG